MYGRSSRKEAPAKVPRVQVLAAPVAFGKGSVGRRSLIGTPFGTCF